MTKGELPKEPVLNLAFSEKGRDNVVKVDVVSIRDGQVLKLTFESVNSPWRQGVWLKTDEYLPVNHQKSPSIQIWQDTAPAEVVLECHTRNGYLHLYNI